jgi:hypothetical protein
MQAVAVRQYVLLVVIQLQITAIPALYLALKPVHAN